MKFKRTPMYFQCIRMYVLSISVCFKRNYCILNVLWSMWKIHQCISMCWSILTFTQLKKVLHTNSYSSCLSIPLSTFHIFNGCVGHSKVQTHIFKFLLILACNMLWVTCQNIELCAISKGVHLFFFSQCFK